MNTEIKILSTDPDSLVKTFERPSRMTMALADDLLQTVMPVTAEFLVDDYELRGNKHYYYLTDGDYVVITKHQVTYYHLMGEKCEQTIIAVAG